MKMLRGIIIDPITRTIREEQLPDTLAGLQAAVGGGYIEAVHIEALGNAVFYCDEEGKNKEFDGAVLGNFIFRGREHDPFAGPCLILGPGDSEGNETSTKLTVDAVAPMVTWL